MSTEYYYPTFDEFIRLAVLVVVLCAAGGLFLAWRRDRAASATPLWITIAVGVAMGVVYISIAWYLVEHTFWKRRPTLILYSLAFWLIPLAYYTRLIMNALAASTVDKLSWLEVHIGDTSEFSMARQLAGKGDIDGAVRVYRNYTKNKLGAFNEAARLLQVNGRAREALNMYEEISQRFADNRPAVAEALYHQAVIHEKELGNMQEAVVLYRRIYDQTPDSEWGRLSVEALRRTPRSAASLLSELDAAYEGRQEHTPEPVVWSEQQNPAVEASILRDEP
jgi:tetratricopeptide (TPR) repeat protein